MTLVVKVGLVLAALVAGYLFYRTQSRGRTRILLVETGLALLIIGTTSTLSSLTPARDSYTTDVATRLDFGRSEILEVAIDTVRRGSQVVTVSYPGSGDTAPRTRHRIVVGTGQCRSASGRGRCHQIRRRHGDLAQRRPHRPVARGDGR